MYYQNHILDTEKCIRLASLLWQQFYVVTSDFKIPIVSFSDVTVSFICPGTLLKRQKTDV